MPSSPDPDAVPSERAADHSGATAPVTESWPLSSTLRRRLGLGLPLGIVVLVGVVGVAAAGNGMTLSKQSRDAMTVPRWLYLLTGGGVIGASAALASVVTNRKFVRSVQTWSRPGPAANRLWRPLRRIGQALGVLALVLAVVVGLTGPQLPAASLTVLLTFVVVRAGLPMVTYLGGNLWPTLNPWRTLLAPLPGGFLPYPRGLHRWPAVGGLLLLVWVEVIFPVSTVPRVLALAILGYTALTAAGAVLFGPETWFDNGDPLSVLFEVFGTIAPVRGGPNGLVFTRPGSVSASGTFTHPSDLAFVIGLIWELTYSGAITTAPGAAAIRTLVQATDLGVLGTDTRAALVYSVLLLGGFFVFLGAFWTAGVLSRRVTGTYLTVRRIVVAFGPPLVAIAAGYHLAHYVGLVLSLSPALGMALTAPLAPPTNPLVLAPPGWFDALDIAFVLLGHVLAIWEAHASAFETFASRLVAIRSQYPFVAVMIGYTVLSLWILSLPSATPPFLP